MFVASASGGVFRPHEGLRRRLNDFYSWNRFNVPSDARQRSAVSATSVSLVHSGDNSVDAKQTKI